jgi:F0F1-type ATP synthase epsilon subunit
MSALKPGVLVYRTKSETGTLAIGPGFLQVAPVADQNTATDRVLVLVEQAQTAGHVDKPAAEKELAAAEHELSQWKRELDGEYQALLLRRQWAAARVDAAARLAPH